MGQQFLVIKLIVTGILVGLIATALGSSIWILTLSDTDFMSTIKNAYQQKLLAPIVSAGALLNIVALVLFIKQQKFYQARGVIIATLLVAVFVIIQKFG